MTSIRTYINLVESAGHDDEEAEAVFLGGDCGTFAYALHQKTGWPAVSDGNHVWLMNPAGRAVDIRGVHQGATAHLSGGEGHATPHRISSRDVQNRDNLVWANRIISEQPGRFGLEQEVIDEVRKTRPLWDRPDADERMAARSASGKPIGKVDALEVRLDDTESGMTFVTLVDQGKPVGYADFRRQAHGHIQIEMLRLLKRFQGKRIMPRVLLLLAQQGIMVESDDDQTTNAAKMWAYLYDHAASAGCAVQAFHGDSGKLIPLASPTKTATGRLIYGKQSPFTLALVKA